MNPRLHRAMIASPKYRNAVMALGPVGYWRLGEASGTVAVDEMGANDGTYFNAPTLGVAGLLAGDPNTAVTFTGATDTMSSASTIGQAGWSLACWTNASAQTGKPVLGKWAINDGAMVYASGAFAGGGISVFNGAASVESTVAVLDGERHLIVGTWDGAAVRLYVDGSANNSAASAVAPGNGGVFQIASSTGVSTFFTGTIDEPAVWNRALAPAEIARLYQIGRGF